MSLIHRGITYRVKLACSALNRSLKNKFRFPLKRKSKFDALQKRYDLLADYIGCPTVPSAQLKIVKAPVDNFADQEVCIFVSYAPQAYIKPHVEYHLKHLMGAGIKVILVMNTEDIHCSLPSAKPWMEQLSAIYVRENIGLDFAAWGQIFSLLDKPQEWKRLFLINDSIVGPVDIQAFNEMLHKIRTRDADLIGLVSNVDPWFHLQSFFLVFGKNLLCNKKFHEYFSHIKPYSDKQLVIDVYEKRLTKYFEKLGCAPEALYSLPLTKWHKSNDTITRWENLIESGFPYIKASVLSSLSSNRQKMTTKLRDILEMFEAPSTY